MYWTDYSNLIGHPWNYSNFWQSAIALAYNLIVNYTTVWCIVQNRIGILVCCHVLDEYAIHFVFWTSLIATVFNYHGYIILCSWFNHTEISSKILYGGCNWYIYICVCVCVYIYIYICNEILLHQSLTFQSAMMLV